jgi:hypothetical protein
MSRCGHMSIKGSYVPLMRPAAGGWRSTGEGLQDVGASSQSLFSGLAPCWAPGWPQSALNPGWLPYIRFEHKVLLRLLCSGGDLNPISGFCFPLFSRCFRGKFPSG